jgi:hypothetical protein
VRLVVAAATIVLTPSRRDRSRDAGGRSVSAVEEEGTMRHISKTRGGPVQRSGPFVAATLLVGAGLAAGLGLGHLPLRAGSVTVGSGGMAATTTIDAGTAYAAYHAYRVGEWQSAGAIDAGTAYAAYHAYRVGEWQSAGR